MFFQLWFSVPSSFCFLHECVPVRYYWYPIDLIFEWLQYWMSFGIWTNRVIKMDVKRGRSWPNCTVCSPPHPNCRQRNRLIHKSIHGVNLRSFNGVVWDYEYTMGGNYKCLLGILCNTVPWITKNKTLADLKKLNKVIRAGFSLKFVYSLRTLD